MGTLTVRVADAQGFLYNMLLSAKNVPRLGRHLFPRGTAALKGINTVIAKESYLDVGQFEIPLRKYRERPTIDYLDLELAQRGNYQTEAAFPTRFISGHTVPTGSGLFSRLPRNGAIGAVAPLATAAAKLFITTITTASGLPTLRSIVSAHGTHLISCGTIRAVSTSTVTTSFAVLTITPGLVTATITATPAMPTAAMAAAGSEHFPPAPGTSECDHLAPAPRASEGAHHAGHAEHHQDVSQFHQLADRVRHLQHQQRHQTVRSQ